MDSLDREILAHLSTDARMSVAVLARKLRVARSTVQARIERLENNGTIAGYTLKLGEAVRLGRIRATVLLSIEPNSTVPVLARLKTIAEIERVNTTSGRFDLLLQVVTETPAALDAVLDQIGATPGVKSSESLIQLSTKFDRAQ